MTVGAVLAGGTAKVLRVASRPALTPPQSDAFDAVPRAGGGMGDGSWLGRQVRFDICFFLAQNYGLEFGEPPWLADIMARYHLTPPPS